MVPGRLLVLAPLRQDQPRIVPAQDEPEFRLEHLEEHLLALLGGQSKRACQTDLVPGVERVDVGDDDPDPGGAGAAPLLPERLRRAGELVVPEAPQLELEVHPVGLEHAPAVVPAGPVGRGAGVLPGGAAAPLRSGRVHPHEEEEEEEGQEEDHARHLAPIWALLLVQVMRIPSPPPL